MTYIKTVDASGNVVSLQAISDASGAPEGAVPSIVLKAGQSFMTPAEYQAAVTKFCMS